MLAVETDVSAAEVLRWVAEIGGVERVRGPPKPPRCPSVVNPSSLRHSRCGGGFPLRKRL